MTARKLHFATSTVQNADDALHGAADSVLCEQQPRQGATLWATIVTEDVDCAKCSKRLAEIHADLDAELAEIIEPVVAAAEVSDDTIAAPADEPAVEIEPAVVEPVAEQPKPKRKAKAKTVVGTELTDSKTQKEQLRAFNSGANYAANAARYGDADKALLRYTKRRERQGNPAAQHELDSFAEGYADAAAKLAK